MRTLVSIVAVAATTVTNVSCAENPPEQIPVSGNPVTVPEPENLALTFSESASSKLPGRKIGDTVADYQIETFVDEIFGLDAPRAKRIISCESGWNPNAVSHTNDHGLMQINATTWNKPNHSDPVARFIGANWGKVYDPYTNLVMGRKIQQKYGWSMWACNRLI